MAKERKPGRFEITMYKLLVIFVISIFVSLGLGIFIGQSLGEAQTLKELELPEYCSVSSDTDGNSIRCNEIGTNLSANDVCSILSTQLKDKLRVVLIP